jgi:hypothetical protein
MNKGTRWCDFTRRLLVLLTGLFSLQQVFWVTSAVCGDLEKRVHQRVSASVGGSDVVTAAIPSHIPRKGAPGIGEIPRDEMCDGSDAPCTWEHVFGGALQEKAYGIASMPGDEVVVVGNRRPYGGFGDNAWILRLGRSGELMWQREFGGLNNDQVYAVAAAKDGGVVVTGHTRSKGAGKSDI